ncbi:hypothetical protein PENSPDRAFT_694842 [Peniophora sp. CONT]|nr:hypothetical protein PENSPDRAFT_694842 [Peniophora sp. CONT]
MPPPAAINGIRETFLMRFISYTETSGKQTQVLNNDQKDKYENLSRAFVLAFGHKNTLKNDEPGEFYNVLYDSIPAAQDMPSLGDEAEEAERDAAILRFVEPIKNFYKSKRHQAKKAGGPALLNSKQLQRVVNALGPPPPPPKELDVYQKYYKDRYSDAFEKLWAEKEAAADGNGKALEALKRKQGGQERVFAGLRYARESEQVKDMVRKKGNEIYEDAMKEYGKLWGAPLEMPGNSRAWVMPEASTFLQAFLTWIATRYCVAATITIAGANDDGSPEARSLFAAGECKPGVPSLADCVAGSLADTKIKMMQFARDMMTGRVPTGESAAASIVKREEGKEAADDEEMEDLTARLEFDTQPMRVFGEDEGLEWNGAPALQPTIRTSVERQRSELGQQAGGQSEEGLGGDDGGNQVYTALAKGKGVDRTGMVDKWRSNASGSAYAIEGQSGAQADEGQTFRRRGSPEAVGYEKKRNLAFRPERRREGGLMADVEMDDDGGANHDGQSANDPFANDPFANMFDDEDNYPLTDLAFPLAQNMTPRSTTPETSSSVYAKRRAGLSESPGLSDSERGDALSQSDGRPVAEDLESVQDGMIEDVVTDSDVEQADAYAADLWTDRRQQGTKEKHPRTLLLGGVGRSRAAASRKRETLPPKANDKETSPDKDTSPTNRRAKKDRNANTPKLTMRRALDAVHPHDAAFSPPPARRRKQRTLRIGSPEGADDEHEEVVDDVAAREWEEGGGDEEERTDYGRMEIEPVVNPTGDDVEIARIEGWIREHDDGDDAGGAPAWKTYKAKIGGGGSRRARLVATIKDLTPSLRPVYADLVDAMEALLKVDEKWDAGVGGQLDKTDRPSLVTQMVKCRGGPLSSGVALPTGWGSGLSSWWISLQPSERGGGAKVEDLSSPTRNMEWGTLGTSSGYKGPFLLVWCMMYWAQRGDDVESWRAVGEDMILVFKVLRAAREQTGGGGATSGNSSNVANKVQAKRVKGSAERVADRGAERQVKKARLTAEEEIRESEKGNLKPREKGNRKPGDFGWGR